MGYLNEEIMAIDDLENEDYINPENSDGLNEDDDSFGLPDVEYQPLDDSENQYGQETGIETNAGYASEYDTQEGDGYDENTYSTGYEDDSMAGNAYEEETERQDSKTPMIIVLVLVFLLGGGILGYLFWWKPMQGNSEEFMALKKEGVALLEKNKWEEAITKFEEAKKLENVSDTELSSLGPLMTKAKSGALAEQKAAEAALEQETIQNAENMPESNTSEPIAQEAGTVETVSDRTGRYHVVIASSFDGDLANDYADKLAKEGKSVKVLQPYGKKKFFRVAVASFDDLMAAEAHSIELKEEFGGDTWVTKY